jgi:hypothetical protein
MDITPINPIGSMNLRNSSSYRSKPVARKPRKDVLQPDVVTLSQDAGDSEEDDKDSTSPY